MELPHRRGTARAGALRHEHRHPALERDGSYRTIRAGGVEMTICATTDVAVIAIFGGVALKGLASNPLFVASAATAPGERHLLGAGQEQLASVAGGALARSVR